MAKTRVLYPLGQKFFAAPKGDMFLQSKPIINYRILILFYTPPPGNPLAFAKTGCISIENLSFIFTPFCYNLMITSHSSTHLSLIRHAFLHPADWESGSAVYRKYSAIIRGTLRRMRVNSPDEDDIIHETLQRVISHFQNFQRKRRGAFRAWIRRVARSAMLEWYRRNPPASTLPARAVADAIADSVSTEYEIELAQATVAAVRLELNPQQWEMFDRLRLRGESAQSIAALYGVTPFAVYKAGYRVTLRLQQVRNRLEKGRDR